MPTQHARAQEVRAQERVSGLVQGSLPGEALVPILMTSLLSMAATQTRTPENTCIGACGVLREAYGLLGLRAEIRAVVLTVDDADGNVAVYGSFEPSWQGSVLTGHCILLLPESGRTIDPTAEQYPEVARFGLGAVVGRTLTTLHSPRDAAVIAAGGMPAGGQIVMRRGDATLGYVLASDEATAVITDSEWLAGRAQEYRRAGANLAGWTLDVLRRPQVIARARSSGYPRVVALLDAIGDAPYDHDAAENWYFLIAGEDGLPLPRSTDELLLPIDPTTPR